MIRIAYAAGLVMLLCAGVLFSLCGMRWRQGVSHDADISEPLGVTEGARVRATRTVSGDPDFTPPLIKQATAFALYLRPPAPPASKELPRAKPGGQPVPRPPTATPKFVLLSTSCYRFCPEKSLALVAEPGKGGYWVRKGERVGHMVVEDIKDGAILYRDGSQLRELAVAIKDVAPLAQPKAGTPIAMQSVRPALRSMNVPQRNGQGSDVPGVHGMAGEGMD